MTIKKELVFLIVVIVQFSCSKEIEFTDPNKKYVVEGYLYKDCSMEPIKGMKLYLYHETPTLLFAPDPNPFLDSCVTDSTGYIKLTYKENKGYKLYITHPSGYGFSNVIESVPSNINYIDLNLYLNPTVDLEVYLNVKKEYTDQDTLIVNDFKTWDGYREADPFKSGLFYRSEDVPLHDMSFQENYYHINCVLVSKNPSLKGYYYTVTEYCDNTVKVTIDVE